jgi:hypothetical protein
LGTKGQHATPRPPKPHVSALSKVLAQTAGHVARMGEGRGVYRVLVGKPEGKRPLGRPSRRWEDHVNVYWTTATGISGHCSTTLTEGFPSFFLSCKANARV